MAKLKKRQIFKQKEKDVQKAIADMLMMAGWLVIRINSGGWHSDNRFLETYKILNTNNSSGFPDLIAMKGNRFLLIECKSTDGKLRKTQKEFIDLAEYHNVSVIVANNVGDVVNYLNVKDISKII